MGTIYLLENVINGKAYVGQTVQPFHRRMAHHLCAGHLCIDEAIRKYGIENFKITTMNCSEKYLDWMEQKWIKEMNSLAPNGYNLDSGGHETKHHSEETIRKMSKPRVKRLSDEIRKKMSESHKGLRNNLGHRLTKEQKKAKSLRQMGRPGTNNREVFCVEMNTKYSSIAEAHKITRVNKSSIVNCCKNQKQLTAGGYHWEYV